MILRKPFVRCAAIVLCTVSISSCGGSSSSLPREPCSRAGLTESEREQCLKDLALVSGPITSIVGEEPPFDSSMANKMQSQAPTNATPSDIVPQSVVDEIDKVFRVGGKFRVDESGSATYSIPIVVPTGTAGVTPEISLNYSSSGGNGVMGLGWSVSASDGISRCRQTLLKNRMALPIQWNNEDRFCLNGQQLIAIDGEYGAVGTAYQREMDSQTTLVSVSGTLGHPDYFVAESKDGSKTYYGDAGSSKTEHRGTVLSSNFDDAHNPVLTWSVSRFEDNIGNYIRYDYESQAGYHLLKEIRYGYGAGSAFDRHLDIDSEGFHAVAIEFLYGGRNDVSTQYVAGYKFTQDKLLDTIKVFASGSAERAREEVRVYKLSYRPVAQDMNVPERLGAVTECATSDGPCSTPLSFQWGNPDYQDETKSIELAKERVEQYRLADLNGDGRLDFIWTEKEGSDSVRLYFSVTGTDEVRDMGTLRDVDSFRVNDFNLDGLADIAHIPADSSDWHLRMTRPGFEGNRISFSSSQPFDNSASPELVVDLNTDGMLDTYELTKDRKLHVRYGLRRNNDIDAPNPYGFADEVVGASIPNGGDLASGTHALGDFNGDGIVDIVVRSWDASATSDGVSGDRRLDVMIGLPNGMYKYWQNLYAGNRRPLSVHVGDLNSDGLSDLIYQLEGDKIDYSIDGPRYYRLSTGTGFTAAVEPDECKGLIPNLIGQGIILLTGPCSRVRADYGLGDVNGDGYLDFYFHVLSGLYYKLWDPKTDSFGDQKKLREIDSMIESEGAVAETDWEVSRLADMNGDGTIDVVTRIKPRKRSWIAKVYASS